ncbi:anosmin-1b [Neolamprologus brichardi]|uniref:anosmin-1b n=1 Tax=Neolamprologus brichardi TaxID=32507 RepID=UPI0016437E64|nr:anosmin-1b [Neolamprologus brichardi]
MSVRRAGLVLLCAMLAVTCARRSSPEQEDVQEKTNSARCTSRCLTLHMTQLTAAFRHLQSDQVLVWCENHRRCAQCLQPCKELWETRKVASPKSCEKQTECVTSREFLASLRSSRQGDCPPPQRATGFAAACVESCSSDQHCPSPRKCCSNSCGHTCQAPANLYKGVPLKPRRDISFLEDSEGRVKVTWVSKFNVSVEPVVYMLQSRWNIGIHPSEDHASPWATVAMAQCEVWLHGLPPATSYLLSVQTVAYWGQKRLKSPRVQLVFTTIPHADSTKGDDFSNELPSSSSSSSSSLPSSLLISSFSPSSSDLPVSSSLPHPETPLSPIALGNLRLEVAAPHYHNNQLQVKVFWKWPQHVRQRHAGPYILRWRPHTCSTNVTSMERTATVQGTHHTITGLLFACKYRVAVALKADPRSEAVAWLTTPTCSSVRVRGGKSLLCNTEKRLLSGRKVVLRPERLTADFQQVNGTLLATFRWRLSQHALHPTAVEGFQFTWTLQSEVSGKADGLEDTLISQTQTIAPSQRSVSVYGLQADSVYQLQLQVLTAGGSSGTAVSKTIYTPAINTTL